MAQHLLPCLKPVKKYRIECSLLVDFETFLVKLESVDANEVEMETRKPFKFPFPNHCSCEAYVTEDAVVEALHTKSTLMMKQVKWR